MFTVFEALTTVVSHTSTTDVGTSVSASGLLDSLSNTTTLYVLILISIPLAIARGITMSKRVDL
ncbi:MAG: hypothetical protein Q4P71_07630 [Actinomycetaceae bacterium]|nr:hypothetical protein [Actinomycetaceae bacterium]